MSFALLLTALSDGKSRHVTELAQIAQTTPAQLNGLWQQAPQYLHNLLRQNDGYWKLAKAIALLPKNTRHPLFDVQVQPETTSTNTLLLDDARSGCSIHQRVIAAHTQNAGRGQQGKSWHNQLGECLMFSVGWTFAQTQAELGALSLVVALACQRALSQLGCAAQIKWSNDLVIGMDKLGGILIETVRHNNQTHAVIGIGINFLVPEHVDNSTSFQAASNEKHSVAEVFTVLLNVLHQHLTQFAQTGFAPFQAAYEAAHRDQNQTVYLLRGEQIAQYGYALGVTVRGELCLQTDYGGVQYIASGEVSLRRPEQLHANSHHYLLLDSGNSRLKWAWVENGVILRTGQAPYRDLSRLTQEWAEYGQAHTRIVGSSVCSAAKRETVAYRLQRPIEWLTSMPHALGMINHYRNPEEHGADRWFNALGSRKFSHNASVVVSCGTAVTIDAITADNHYLGGSIMPGFHLMHESLLQKTANLHRPEGQRYPFPTTTANAIATGMMDAVCGSILLMHARLKERNHNQPTDLIITGGGARKIAEALPEAFSLDYIVKIVDNILIFGLINWLYNEPSLIE